MGVRGEGGSKAQSQRARTALVIGCEERELFLDVGTIQGHHHHAGLTGFSTIPVTCPCLSISRSLRLSLSLSLSVPQ